MKHYDFGTSKWIFIDWMGIDPGYGVSWNVGDIDREGQSAPKGIELNVHKPVVQPEWIMQPDQPWEQLGTSPYASFIEDGGRFHCWYLAYNQEHFGFKDFLAYAVSDDSVHWEEPSLGVVDFEGSTANNLTDFVGTCCSVFIDPSAPPEEQYKTAAHFNWDRPADAPPGVKWWRQVGGAVSPDGLHWTALPEPILRWHFNDTQSIVQYSPVMKKYLLFTRQKDGVMKRRGINLSISDDFQHFPDSMALFEASPLDPPDWDFQNPGYHAWPGTDHAHLLLMTIFERTRDANTIHLATSRDLAVWHRPMGREALIGTDDVHLDKPVKQVWGCAGILPTAPGEWSIYLRPDHKGHNEQKSGWETNGFLRATLREDGFMSLSACNGGEFWTIPFECRSDRIALNVCCHTGGALRVAVINEGDEAQDMANCKGQPVEGFSLNDCEAITGDGVDLELRWRGGSLKQLAGRTIRLHVEVARCDLYAIRFSRNGAQ